MKENFDKALAYVLKSEGGYVNNPADPGGMTNLGCTKTVWEEWVGHPVDEKAMRNLTPADVAPLYRRKYWDKISGDLLPTGLDYVVFDCSINSGAGRAIKLLQETVGVTADGNLGPITLKAVAKMNTASLIDKYQQNRLAFLQSLPTWSKFGHGWGNRIAEVKSYALIMVS